MIDGNPGAPGRATDASASTAGSTGDPAAGTASDTASDTAAAIAEVEEQLSVLAGLVRTSLRDSALSVDPTLQPFGLKLLRHLARHGPTHATVVAAALYVDKSVISRQAKALCELGLLETQEDPDDGRARFLAVTPLAVQRLSRVRAGDTAIVHKRLGDWPAGELRQLAALLARLNSP